MSTRRVFLVCQRDSFVVASSEDGLLSPCLQSGQTSGILLPTKLQAGNQWFERRNRPNNNTNRQDPPARLCNGLDTMALEHNQIRQRGPRCIPVWRFHGCLCAGHKPQGSSTNSNRPLNQASLQASESSSWRTCRGQPQKSYSSTPPKPRDKTCQSSKVAKLVASKTVSGSSAVSSLPAACRFIVVTGASLV